MARSGTLWRRFTSGTRRLDVPAVEAALDKAVAAMFTVQPPQVLYHYTSWEAAEGILMNQEFWATSFDCTNDHAELVSADAVIIDVAQRLQRSTEEPFRTVLRMFLENYDTFHVRQTMPVYLTCFSTGRDDRHFWCSDYAKHGEGVCLGVRVLNENGPTSRSEGGSLIEVGYSEDSLRSNMAAGFDRVCSVMAQAERSKEAYAHGLTALYRIAALASISTKQAKWATEKEFRLATLVHDSENHQPKQRDSDGRVIKYLPVRVRAEQKRISVAEVIVGPNQDPAQGRAEAERILCAAGYVSDQPEYPERITPSAVAPCESAAIRTVV